MKKEACPNLYLIKEVDDEGGVSAVYAFSMVGDSISDDLLAYIREAAATHLSAGEMRGSAYEQKPDEWWERDPERAISRVESGKPDGFMDLLVAELAPKGIIITERQVR